MSFKAIVHGFALIAVLGFISAGQVARADDCDDEQDELKKLIERVINYTPNPRGIGPVCAATGQILGVTKAAREVAAECYDDGRKPDQRPGRDQHLERDHQPEQRHRGRRPEAGAAAGRIGQHHDDAAIDDFDARQRLNGKLLRQTGGPRRSS